ncbi:MAG: hypothetical protein RIB93_29225 [Coleofasciculus sp. D1-CHI-01]|uniref:hypothetical protein n=1 Tax=Coleofasciculus sp. D1-CHI-01 TaxID=3068482 RepID=UPI0032F53AD4
MTVSTAMTHSPFNQLVKNLFQTTQQVDVAFNTLKEKATEINDKYDPRSSSIL